jgi:hypothetical protein
MEMPTGCYPYPFIDVTTIGIKQALINAVMILLSFLAIPTLVVFIGKKLLNQQRASGNDRSRFSLLHLQKTKQAMRLIFGSRRKVKLYSGWLWQTRCSEN